MQSVFAGNLKAFRTSFRENIAHFAIGLRLPTNIGGFNSLVFIGFTTIVIILAVVFLDPHAWGVYKIVTPTYGPISQTITHYGKSEWILIPTAIVLVVALFVNWSTVDSAVRIRAHRWLVAAGFTFTSVASIGLFVAILKRFVGRARPLHFDELGYLHFSPFNDASFASFPSGHATTTGAFCAALILLKPKFAVPVVIFGVVVGFSRVFVGAHYFSDVIAGLLLGSMGTYWIAQRFLKIGLAKPSRNWAWRWPTSDEWRKGPFSARSSINPPLAGSD